MTIEGQGGNPEAVYWRTDDQRYGVACSRCEQVDWTRGTARIEAVELAQSHLLHVHGLRRVWIEHLDRSVAPMVQMALPIVMAGQARARERAVLGPVG